MKANIFGGHPQSQSRGILEQIASGEPAPETLQRMSNFFSVIHRLDPAWNARMIEQMRNNGNRADLNRPVSPDPAASYGMRPPVMDPFLPDFERYQRYSIE